MPKKFFSPVRVAVMPFENLSGGEDMSFFAQGLGEDITTDLSRFGGIQVMASRSVRNLKDVATELQPDYIIKGSFRQSERFVRISTQLLSAKDTSMLWAERYSEKLEMIFEVQDDIVQKIVSALQKQIDFDLLAKSHQKSTGSLQAYDHWLRGMDALRNGTRGHDLEAREHFQNAIEIDPLYARAHTGLSLSYFNEWSCQLWERWDVSQSGAQEYALKAIDLDPDDYLSLAVLGRTYLYNAEYDKAEHCLRKSLRINPNDADNLIQIASCMTYLGYVNEAITLYTKAVNLNPLHPDWYLAYGSFIYFELGDFERCIEAGLRIRYQDIWVDFMAFMAAAAFWLERFDLIEEFWDHFLDQHRIKILRAENSDHDKAVLWMYKINPFRFESKLQPFLEFMTERSNVASAISAAKPSSEKGTIGQLSDNKVPGINSAISSGIFLKENELWTIGMNGASDKYAEVKGFSDIAQLLTQPEKEWHCAELMGSALTDSTKTLVLDDKSRKAYKTRIADLQSEIAEAEDHNNLAAADKLSEEYETLIEHLSASLGLSGKARVTGSSVEKARSAITWRIRSAITRIEKVNPQLAKHLTNSIKTGTMCSYRPAVKIDWQL